MNFTTTAIAAVTMDGENERGRERLTKKTRINEKICISCFLRSAENQNVCTYLNWYDHYDNIR